MATFLQKFRGNASVEYVLPILVVVALSGALTFSADIQGLLREATVQSNNGTLNGRTLITESQGANVNPAQAARLNAAPPAPGEEQVCFAEGFCLNMVVAKEGALPDISGSNGTELTRKFANTLLQLAERLKETGTADANLITRITTLANEGHNVANNQLRLEKVCPNTRLNAVCQVGEYTRNDLSFARNHLEDAFREVTEYLDSNPSSLRPELEQIIENEFRSIQSLATGYLKNNNQHKLNGEDVIQVTFGKVDLARKSANTICETGGDVNSCLVSGNVPSMARK